MIRMNSNVPARKVTAAALAAAVTQVLIWSVAGQNGLRPMEVPPEVVTAITTIMAFAFGYLMPPSKNDLVVDAADYAQQSGGSAGAVDKSQGTVQGGNG